MATQVAGERPVGEARRVLANEPVRRADAAGTADGPSASAEAIARGRERRGEAGRGVERTGEAPEPTPRGDAVHDAAVELGGGAEPLERTGGGGDRQPGRGAEPNGGRSADRLLREHAGVAAGSVVGADGGRVAEADEGAGAIGAGASGLAVRSGGGAGEAAAQYRASAAVPGDVRLAQHARPRLDDARPDRECGEHGDDDVAIRPRAVDAGTQRRHRRAPELCDGAVRRTDGASLRALLAPPAGRHDGRIGERVRRPFAVARRSRTRTGGARVECNGARLPDPAMHPSVVRSAGGAHPERNRDRDRR
ncbi:Uncharacterised protein [Burkholderia pseudomallei]|nr:Uncharacterised protein [Burkholderia pseudomallei]